MAYNLSERFIPPPTSHRLLDPGAYQSTYNKKCVLPNTAPFLSYTPRKTQPGGQIWSHAIYDPVVSDKIPNITCMFSKRPRFPNNVFDEKDLDTFLCRCGIQHSCECPVEGVEEKVEKICQGKIRKRIFKGPSPKSLIGEGLSASSKNDKGFEIFPNGSQKRLLPKINDESPPFYDATIHEATAFYHGCKWSLQSSKRSSKSKTITPGPGYYYYEKHFTDFEKCAEKFRCYRRKTSKQLRFIESVQRKTITEAHPGPATYTPILPQGIRYASSLGSKSRRFTVSILEQCPGPADYNVKRTFDQPDFCGKRFFTKLPKPSFFGVKAPRFKPALEREASPGPANYNVLNYKYRSVHSSARPFGSSAVRFKENLQLQDEKESENFVEKDLQKDFQGKRCPRPSWQFRSKTRRMKPLEKEINQPSPADLAQPCTKVHRRKLLQYVAPFFTSAGRFQPWHDWMPISGSVQTPGPCCYNLVKPKCYPAVKCGPLYRASRFPTHKMTTPPPNKYNECRDIENILKTHNMKLKDNIERRHKFIWTPPVHRYPKSYEEREKLLLLKSIDLLNTFGDDIHSSSSFGISVQNNEERPKLLRCYNM